MQVIQPTPSRAAYIVRDFLMAEGIEVKISLAQEAVARALGYVDWQALANDVDPRNPKVAVEAAKRIIDAPPVWHYLNPEQVKAGDWVFSRFVALLHRAQGVRLHEAGSLCTLKGPIHAGLWLLAFPSPYSQETIQELRGKTAFSCQPQGETAPSAIGVSFADILDGRPIAENAIRLSNGLELWLKPETDEYERDAIDIYPATVVMSDGQVYVGSASYARSYASKGSEGPLMLTEELDKVVRDFGMRVSSVYLEEGGQRRTMLQAGRFWVVPDWDTKRRFGATQIRP
ncbi:hypothetical protein F6X40_11400 [Paraburkholderia sp. UCT31]|uniref:hypothetical protein n=1 Tax=Paraburkholderia sp. UCT31 TaxID=2615209 RepID=UPI00165542D9|nr:hypothetical protein [Paraburkholderia sp. UCT31]MBC8737410.1 hypothetical protein [Paraburkholderia sp. UCT31]